MLCVLQPDHLHLCNCLYMIYKIICIQTPPELQLGRKLDISVSLCLSTFITQITQDLWKRGKVVWHEICHQVLHMYVPKLFSGHWNWDLLFWLWELLAVALKSNVFRSSLWNKKLPWCFANIFTYSVHVEWNHCILESNIEAFNAIHVKVKF